VVTSLAAPLSGRLVGTRGTRIPLLVAGIGMSVGGLMLVGLQPDTSLGYLIASYVVLAIGFGMVNAPITNSAVSGMPRSQAGVAAAVASTSRQVGSALGVAIIGSVLNSGLHGQPLGTGFTHASVAAWWVVVGCGVAVLALGLYTSSANALRSAERVARAFDEDRQPVAAGAPR
jgi:MFS family permease